MDLKYVFIKSSKTLNEYKHTNKIFKINSIHNYQLNSMLHLIQDLERLHQLRFWAKQIIWTISLVHLILYDIYQSILQIQISQNLRECGLLIPILHAFNLGKKNLWQNLRRDMLERCFITGQISTPSIQMVAEMMQRLANKDLSHVVLNIVNCICWD